MVGSLYIVMRGGVLRSKPIEKGRESVRWLELVQSWSEVASSARLSTVKYTDRTRVWLASAACFVYISKLRT
jgi:hypothetical protein